VLCFMPVAPGVNALEFGGNYVLRRLQNPLTKGQKAEPKTGIFPFYEEIVRDLLKSRSERPYDDDDRLRYRHPDAITSLLQINRRAREALVIPDHLINPDTYSRIGVVRPLTQGAEHIWRRQGFAEKDPAKFDALDGGKIIEIDFDTFKQTFRNRLSVLKVSLD